MAELIQPLDLEKILVNNLAESIEIFFFLMAAVLVYLAARFKMPNIVTLTMMGLFGILFGTYFGMDYITVIVILIFGFIFYFALTKIFK